MFPKNIKKWLLAWLTFPIGPFTVSIIQLFIIAIWVALALVTFSKFQESSKVVWGIFAVIIAIIFLVIAFFNVSELNILAFTVKFIQDHFFDTTEKFQTNYNKPNKTELTIKRFKTEDGKQKIDYKTEINFDDMDKLDDSSLL